MKPSYTQAFDSIANCSIAALEERRYSYMIRLNASRSKGISLFSTRKSALHWLGLYSRAKTFHTPSEEKEDYSACMLRKAEKTVLRL